MANLPSKREVIQEILDREDDLWIIMKPSRKNPEDTDELCVFQNPARWKEARAEIPNAWFAGPETEKIEKAVRDALERAEQGYRFPD